MAVYTWKGTIYLRVLVNTSAHRSITDSPAMMILPVLSSVGVTVVKPPTQNSCPHIRSFFWLETECLHIQAFFPD